MQSHGHGDCGRVVPHHELPVPLHSPPTTGVMLGGKATKLPLLWLLSQRKGAMAEPTTFPACLWAFKTCR